MLHEAGYKTVYVAHDSEHAWVELNGKVYDALFARAKTTKNILIFHTATTIVMQLIKEKYKGKKKWFLVRLYFSLHFYQ